MKFPLKTLLLVWLMFVAIQVSAQTASNEIIINKLPIKDFGSFVVEKIEKDKVDLNAPFLVEFESVLGENGKLDPKLSKFTKLEGDKNLIEIVKNAIAAISDSGYLQYLQQSRVKSGLVTVQQDKDNFSISIKAEVENESLAKSIANALKMLLSVAKIQKAKQVDANDNDDLILLEYSSVLSEGKNFVINFSLPQAVKQEMINRKLDELKKENY